MQHKGFAVSNMFSNYLLPGVAEPASHKFQSSFLGNSNNNQDSGICSFVKYCITFPDGSTHPHWMDVAAAVWFYPGHGIITRQVSNTHPPPPFKASCISSQYYVHHPWLEIFPLLATLIFVYLCVRPKAFV